MPRLLLPAEDFGGAIAFARWDQGVTAEREGGGDRQTLWREAGMVLLKVTVQHCDKISSGWVYQL